MKKNLLLLFAALACCCPALAWGPTGHDAIAHIAERNLTPRAKRTVEKLLGGRSIVYFASWMDNVRFLPAYRETSSWHGADVDDSCRYALRNGGDAVQCIEQAIDRLKEYRSSDDSTTAVSIRFLVHLVGDLHCPVHVKYPWYKDFTFTLVNREHRFHSFWDAASLELTHHWHYTEYGDQLDRATKAERAAIASGTPREWFEQTARDCRVIYEWTAPGQHIAKKESNGMLLEVRALAEQQVLRAGYRLARILNELFG